MNKLKLCIIGAGNESTNSHIPNFLKCSEWVDLRAVCDVNQAAVMQAKDRFDIPEAYTDYREMLSKEKPDIVSVCVPNRFHADIVIDVLRAGCDVFCEKPPAINAQQALQMQQEAEKAGRILTYNFHFRQAPEVREIHRMIQSGEFGRMNAGKAIAYRRRGTPGWGNFTNKALQGGGPLIDIGVHMLDTALYLMDFPKVAYVCASASYGIGVQGGVGMYGPYKGENYTVEDALFGYIQFENGSMLQIETAFSLNTKEDQKLNVEIFGNEKGASVFDGEIYHSTMEGLMIDDQIRFAKALTQREKTSGWKEESVRRFVECCVERKKPFVTPEQGTYIMRLIDALYLSAEKNEPVRIEE